MFDMDLIIFLSICNCVIKMIAIHKKHYISQYMISVFVSWIVITDDWY